MAEDWKPIETAPKDGGKLLIATDGSWTFLCGWISPGTTAQKEGGWVACSGAGDGELHIMYVGSEDGAEAWWVEPTHWLMEMPDVPRN